VDTCGHFFFLMTAGEIEPRLYKSSAYPLVICYFVKKSIFRGQVFIVNSFIFQYSNKSLLLLASSILKNHTIARCPDVVITIVLHNFIIFFLNACGACHIITCVQVLLFFHE